MDAGTIGTILGSLVGVLAPVILEVIRTRWAGSTTGTNGHVTDGTYQPGRRPNDRPMVAADYDTTSHGLFFNIVRVLVRPLLTVSFFLLFAYVTVVTLLWGLHQEHLSIKEVYPVVWNDSTQTLFATIISFWFGSRIMRWRRQ